MIGYNQEKLRQKRHTMIVALPKCVHQSFPSDSNFQRLYEKGNKWKKSKRDIINCKRASSWVKLQQARSSENEIGAST